MRTPALVLSCLRLASTAGPQEPPLSREQQEVWSREEAYWNAMRSRDAKAYITLWHEDFVGWPYFDPEPIHKSDIQKNPFRAVRDSVPETYDITRKAVQVFGDTAVVYYQVTVSFKRSDGKVESRVGRITHTWMKTGGVWLIIGGMLSRVEPSGSK